jgi:hypothetical protein
MELKDRILLLMKYDNSTTLTENTEKLLTEQATAFKSILRSLSGLADETLEKVIGKSRSEINSLISKRGKNAAAEIDDIFKSLKDTKTLATKLLNDYSIFNQTQLDGLIDMLVNQVSSDPKNYSKIIGDLSNEIMTQKNLPQSSKKLIDDYASLISARVKNKLSIKHPDIYNALFKAKGLVKKLSKSEAKNLSSKTIKWWERVLSTDKTIIDILKGWTDDAVNRLILKNQGNQKYIDNLFSKLKQATEDSINHLKRGEKYDITLLRNINTNVRVLADKYKADSNAIYDELEELLNKKYPGRFEEINEIIEQVKKNNPFQTDPPRWGALTQFLNNTATSKLIGNLRKGIFGKERTKEWSEFFERTMSLLVSGAPKSIQEWSSYFKRGTPGLIDLYRDLWVALHVGMPITLSFFSAMANLIGIPAFGNDTEASSFMSDWWNRIVKRYQNMITGWSKFGLILPVHPYGYDVVKFTNDVYAEKYTYAIDDTMTAELNKLSNEELSKFQGYDPNKSRIENIRSIIEVAKQNALKNLKGDNSKDTPKVNTDNSSNNVTIENFYDYLHGLNNLIGVDDLPYMKQDSTNKNMFTFEACLNPPDCNEIEKRTYIYNGTTFVQR